MSTEKIQPSPVLTAATAEASERYSSRLIEDYDGDRYDEDEYGYDATARQAFVAGALWRASTGDREDQKHKWQTEGRDRIRRWENGGGSLYRLIEEFTANIIDDTEAS